MVEENGGMVKIDIIWVAMVVVELIGGWFIMDDVIVEAEKNWGISDLCGIFSIVVVWYPRL